MQDIMKLLEGLGPMGLVIGGLLMLAIQWLAAKYAPQKPDDKTPQPSPAPVPAPNPNDPFDGLPGLPGHPVLNLLRKLLLGGVFQTSNAAPAGQSPEEIGAAVTLAHTLKADPVIAAIVRKELES